MKKSDPVVYNDHRESSTKTRGGGDQSGRNELNSSSRVRGKTHSLGTLKKGGSGGEKKKSKEKSGGQYRRNTKVHTVTDEVEVMVGERISECAKKAPGLPRTEYKPDFRGLSEKMLP